MKTPAVTAPSYLVRPSALMATDYAEGVGVVPDISNPGAFSVPTAGFEGFYPCFGFTLAAGLAGSTVDLALMGWIPARAAMVLSQPYLTMGADGSLYDYDAVPGNPTPWINAFHEFAYPPHASGDLVDVLVPSVFWHRWNGSTIEAAPAEAFAAWGSGLRPAG